MIGKSRLYKARAQAAKWEETGARWAADEAAKRAELESLEQRAGAEVLDGDEGTAARLSAQLAALRAGIDVAARAARTARERLDQARRAVLTARAAELRGEARRLRRDADKRQARTNELLAELAEHEGGAQFVPWEPSRAEVMSAGAAGVRYTVPRTQAMRTRAGQLDQQAAGLEAEAAAEQAPTADRVAAVLAELDQPAEQAEAPAAESAYT